MNFQDWETVTIDKRGQKPNGVSDKTFLNNQIRSGKVVTTLKHGTANQNKTTVVTNTKKIENEEDTFKHKMIGMEMGKRISQARCEKKVTQKDLATGLSLPLRTIQDFESGKAIYNAVVLNKIEKYFGKRIR